MNKSLKFSLEATEMDDKSALGNYDDLEKLESNISDNGKKISVLQNMMIKGGMLESPHSPPTPITTGMIKRKIRGMTNDRRSWLVSMFSPLMFISTAQDDMVLTLLLGSSSFLSPPPPHTHLHCPRTSVFSNIDLQRVYKYMFVHK